MAMFDVTALALVVVGGGAELGGGALSAMGFAGILRSSVVSSSSSSSPALRPAGTTFGFRLRRAPESSVLVLSFSLWYRKRDSYNVWSLGAAATGTRGGGVLEVERDLSISLESDRDP